ncbi:hypothetical protein C0991_004477 [Blastosporella zonata]|nr:hypothetical protein C0991_004477 [Blastosporella zonata]
MDTHVRFVFRLWHRVLDSIKCRQALYPAEVLGYEVRAKGLAFLGIWSQAANCINTFGLPVALEKIGWKVYVIFMVWDAFEVLVIYLFVVETKGLTLEEINDLFTQANPRAYSIQLQRKVSRV